MEGYSVKALNDMLSNANYPNRSKLKSKKSIML